MMKLALSKSQLHIRDESIVSYRSSYIHTYAHVKLYFPIFASRNPGIYLYRLIEFSLTSEVRSRYKCTHDNRARAIARTTHTSDTRISPTCARTHTHTRMRA